MTLTDRDVSILQALYWRGPLITASVREEIFPGDKSGRRTRKRLSALKEAGLIYSRLVIVGPRWDESSSASWALKKAGRALLESQQMQGDPPVTVP
jgi:hypothetical protein